MKTLPRGNNFRPRTLPFRKVSPARGGTDLAGPSARVNILAVGFLSSRHPGPPPCSSRRLSLSPLPSVERNNNRAAITAGNHGASVKGELPISKRQEEPPIYDSENSHIRLSLCQPARRVV